MALLDYIICNQCGYYHESHQSPATDKNVKWNRYTKAELDALFGNRWGSSVTNLVACPSQLGPAPMLHLEDAIQATMVATDGDVIKVRKTIDGWFRKHTDERPAKTSKRKAA